MSLTTGHSRDEEEEEEGGRNPSLTPSHLIVDCLVFIPPVLSLDVTSHTMLVFPTESQRTAAVSFLIPLSWLPVFVVGVNSVEKFETGNDDYLHL